MASAVTCHEGEGKHPVLSEARLLGTSSTVSVISARLVTTARSDADA